MSYYCPADNKNKPLKTTCKLYLCRQRMNGPSSGHPKLLGLSGYHERNGQGSYFLWINIVTDRRKSVFSHVEQQIADYRVQTNHPDNVSILNHGWINSF
jgi:hypothetical protein